MGPYVFLEPLAIYFIRQSVSMYSGVSVAVAGLKRDRMEELE
jgi:hypothetical protein